RCRDDRGVGPRKRTSVDSRERHEARVKQVQRLDASVRLQLHDLALEDLYLEAVERKCARHRISEVPHIPALLEEVPERVIVDAKTGLGEETRIAALPRCLAIRWTGQPQAGQQHEGRG